MVSCQVDLSKMFSLIEYKCRKFLITDCPSDERLPLYVNEFKKFNVKHIVRACQSTYKTDLLYQNNIIVHNMDYDDGGNPPRQVIDRWLDLVDSTFSDCFESNDDNLPTIAVHCVAGLGRAPVLVALALIELGMTPLDSIEFIRKRRRGAFNSKQIKFLDTYKRRKLKSFVLKSAVLKLFTKKTPPPVGMAAAPF